ncbi:hypothetical protein EVAR_31522_1 [Eumeta japonica]|uniref:Uncharacterized protein n=1 Tax=Eumeta variegata TaxID=151549 RepID=A0A4C1Z0Y2_EUMVA|nr:hypothetical protein EVAR_31522_1 [Eumeta japonica]
MECGVGSGSRSIGVRRVRLPLPLAKHLMRQHFSANNSERQGSVRRSYCTVRVKERACVPVGERGGAVARLVQEDAGVVRQAAGRRWRARPASALPATAPTPYASAPPCPCSVWPGLRERNVASHYSHSHISPSRKRLGKLTTGRDNGAVRRTKPELESAGARGYWEVRCDLSPTPVLLQWGVCLFIRCDVVRRMICTRHVGANGLSSATGRPPGPVSTAGTARTHGANINRADITDTEYLLCGRSRSVSGGRGRTLKVTTAGQPNSLSVFRVRGNRGRYSVQRVSLARHVHKGIIQCRCPRAHELSTYTTVVMFPMKSVEVKTLRILKSFGGCGEPPRYVNSDSERR